MFQVPNYIEAESINLSEVLSDIGVNERIVLKRRRQTLLQEALVNIHNKVLLKGMVTYYMMGSQSEGTTTLGLHSDKDYIHCINLFNVIEDLSDWKPGVINFLMIQDDSVSPGYCKLQVLRPDAPLPVNGIASPFTCLDRLGRTLFKNNFISFFQQFVHHCMGVGVWNGPAVTTQLGDQELDHVNVYPCATWPLQARQWLDIQSVGQWPSELLKRYCCSTGCFIVGVGRKGSGIEEQEWRVSTSLAERYLMFSLNVTQIRCYVSMKMIKKSFIDTMFKDVISSYMCKTVLFHCIEINHPNIWRQNDLLVCLSLCLQLLYESVRDESCPHFIIPGNNLMRGKIRQEAKPHILAILRYIIENERLALLDIGCDELGTRLRLKANNICPPRICEIISGKLLLDTSYFIHDLTELYALHDTQEAINRLKQYISNLISIDCHNEIEKTAQNIIVSRFGTLLGSVLASRSIQQYHNISAEALTWIRLSLNIDVASSKLKLATLLYWSRQYHKSEIVLRNIEQNYDQNIVEPNCACHASKRLYIKPGFNAVCYQYDEDALQKVTAHCVRFFPNDIHFVPEELKQEMFRSTSNDKVFRGNSENWMDSAVVDSLTFLYFLQYKIYHNAGKEEHKHKALANLARSIEQEPNLCHRETALNILGQCMEQEHRPRNALQCYSLSLNIRNKNNAAKIHICRLLNHLFHNER